MRMMIVRCGLAHAAVVCLPSPSFMIHAWFDKRG